MKVRYGTLTEKVTFRYPVHPDTKQTDPLVKETEQLYPNITVITETPPEATIMKTQLTEDITVHNTAPSLSTQSMEEMQILKYYEMEFPHGHLI